MSAETNETCGIVFPKNGMNFILTNPLKEAGLIIKNRDNMRIGPHPRPKRVAERQSTKGASLRA
jgi:hypothetical protein